MDVVKEVKSPKLKDKVPGEGSKCVHYGNLWNKTSPSLSKSRFTETMMESRKYAIFLLFLFPEFDTGLWKLTFMKCVANEKDPRKKLDK
uniref:Uncharacterized protein n=1 Tax=Tanacetum cinerariifolium TaxID=118510 RepID=A0A699UEX0_TANCI|nr:hypothetical protein [Tanacetum cinerariifolium]